MKPFPGRIFQRGLPLGLVAFVAMSSTPTQLKAQTPPLPPPPGGPSRPLPLRPAPPALINPNAFQVATPAPVTPVVPANPPRTVTPTPITVVSPSPQVQAAPATDANAIKWDAEMKELTAKVGETNAHFTFWLTNVSSGDVLVNSVRTSCGCTVASLPAQPWRIPAGSNGPINVTMNLVGKSGLIAKGVTVDTSSGIKQLTVRTTIPGAAGAPSQLAGAMNDTERLKNMQLAMADRQVVFKNQDCAKCHADPAKGKTDGRLVYAAVCATCHNSHLRAAMVPDLRTLPHPTDAEHWRKWIAYGRAGSMMPAFAESEGGPLNDQQITALVDFMVKAFPNRPQRAALPSPRVGIDASTPPVVAPKGAPASPTSPGSY